MDYLKTLDVKQASTAAQLEEAINNLDQKTTDYLVSLSKQSLSGVNSHIHHALLENIRDIERVGDHVENLIELIDYKESNRIKLSQEATQELEGMFELVIETVKIAMHALDTRDVSLAQQVRAQEERIDEMERSLRKHHIRRLNEGICSGSAGIVFADIISNLERISDHANNIADTIYEQD